MLVNDVNNIKTTFNENGYFIFTDPVVNSEIVRNARYGIDMIRNGEYDTGKLPEPSPWKPGDDPDVLCKIELPQIANKAITELINSN